MRTTFQDLADRYGVTVGKVREANNHIKIIHPANFGGPIYGFYVSYRGETIKLTNTRRGRLLEEIMIQTAKINMDKKEEEDDE